MTNRTTEEKRAVKVMQRGKDEKKAMITEVKTLSTLDHPNIVKTHEYFEDEKRFYLVNELIEGGALFDEIIARGKLSEKDAAIVMKQLLSAIAHCHSHNIVHRDLKPEIVLLKKSKELDQIKIISFDRAVH